MKFKLLFTTLVLAFVIVTSANAQFELKLNPIGAIFLSPDISAEYGVVPSFGLEGTLSLNFGRFRIGEFRYKNKGFGTRLTAKYYFNPDSSVDRWFTGFYTKYRQGKATLSDDSSSARDIVRTTRVAIGFLFGHKWITKHNLVFELNAGFGRALFLKREYDDGSDVDLSDNPFINWDVVGTFAIGYRFGAKNN